MTCYILSPFAHLATKNIPGEFRDTRPYLHRVQDQPWPFNGPFRAPNRDLMILWGHFWLCLKILHLYSLAPLTMLKHLIGHCTTLPGLRGSSLVFMDPFMDPKKDPARLKTTDKLEFTAKFQVKRTFGSGAIAILRQRMIAPPPLY